MKRIALALLAVGCDLPLLLSSPAHRSAFPKEGIGLGAGYAQYNLSGEPPETRAMAEIGGGLRHENLAAWVGLRGGAVRWYDDSLEKFGTYPLLEGEASIGVNLGLTSFGLRGWMGTLVGGGGVEIGFGNYGTTEFLTLHAGTDAVGASVHMGPIDVAGGLSSPLLWSGGIIAPWFYVGFYRVLLPIKL